MSSSLEIMVQHHDTLTVETRGPGLTDITREVAACVRTSGVRDGLCTLLVLHTSASLVIQENADPSVRADLQKVLSRLVPEGKGYEHDAEGPDDMPAHARSALTATSLSIPVQEGELRLGTWQAIYLWEHRHRAHSRRIAVAVLGE